MIFVGVAVVGVDVVGVCSVVYDVGVVVCCSVAVGCDVVVDRRVCGNAIVANAGVWLRGYCY